MKRLLYCMLLMAYAAPAMAQNIPGPTFDPRDMLERVLPSVVTIAVKQTDGQRAFGFADDRSPATEKALQAYSGQLNLSGFFGGSGSGFVIDQGGTKYVVTNAHVIDRAAANSIFAFSINRTQYRMRLVGADTYRDVAVLAFVDQPRSEITTVSINASDDVRIGTPVYAVGNPMGQFPYTITAGIVSGINRRVQMSIGGQSDVAVGDQGYLQTDATVSWGNSGGPLFGPAGNVLGLNSAIYLTDYLGAPIPLSQINFSLEGRHVARIANDIIRTGRVQRAYVGVVLASENEPGEPMQEGDVTISGVLSETSPLKAHVDAKVVAMNGTPVKTLRDALAIIELARPGSTVTFQLQTAAGRQDVSVTTRPLQRADLTTIGSMVLGELMDLQGAELPGGGGLQVANAPAALDPDQSMTYALTRDGLKEDAQPRAIKRGDKILQAGAVTGEGAGMLWSVRSLEDIGIISRLIAPSGWVALLMQSGKEAYVVDNYIARVAIF